MKVLSPNQHGYLDYLTVLIFLIAPSIFGLEGLSATISYALAVIHLLMTVLTDFPLGVAKLIPFTVHGWVEKIVGPALVLLPFIVGFSGAACIFYIAMGIIIIIVGLVTNYRETSR